MWTWDTETFRPDRMRSGHPLFHEKGSEELHEAMHELRNKREVSWIERFKAYRPYGHPGIPEDYPGPDDPPLPSEEETYNAFRRILAGIPRQVILYCIRFPDLHPEAYNRDAHGVLRWTTYRAFEIVSNCHELENAKVEIAPEEVWRPRRLPHGTRRAEYGQLADESVRWNDE